MCSDPIFIVNPMLQRRFKSLTKLLYNGVFYDVNAFMPRETFGCPDFVKMDYDQFKQWCYYVRDALYWDVPNDQVADDFLFVDDSGFCNSVFVNIPCGKCEDCRLAYASELSSRLQLEALSHGDKPVGFLTLTYADPFLPKYGVWKQDVQKFINRLRSHAARRNWDTFRVFYCSEYGTDPTKTRRPHYHLLIFGLDLYDDPILKDCHKFKEFEALIKKAWPFGRIDFELGRNNRDLCGYVTKYVTKSVRLQDNVPEGKNENFWEGPSRFGGLGIGMLDYIKQNFNFTSESDIICKTTEGLVKVRVPKFILDKLCPPCCRQVTKKLLDTYRNMVKSYLIAQKCAEVLDLSFDVGFPTELLSLIEPFVGQHFFDDIALEVEKMDFSTTTPLYELIWNQEFLRFDPRPSSVHVTDYGKICALYLLLISSVEVFNKARDYICKWKDSPRFLDDITFKSRLSDKDDRRKFVMSLIKDDVNPVISKSRFNKHLLIEGMYYHDHCDITECSNPSLAFALCQDSVCA